MKANWSCKTCKTPVKSSPPTITQHFDRTDAFLLPNQQCQSTEGSRAYNNVPTSTDVLGDLKSVLEESSKHDPK